MKAGKNIQKLVRVSTRDLVLDSTGNSVDWPTRNSVWRSVWNLTWDSIGFLVYNNLIRKLSGKYIN